MKIYTENGVEPWLEIKVASFDRNVTGRRYFFIMKKEREYGEYY